MMWCQLRQRPIQETCPWEGLELWFLVSDYNPKSFIWRTFILWVWKVHHRKSFHRVIYIITWPLWSHKLHMLNHAYSCSCIQDLPQTHLSLQVPINVFPSSPFLFEISINLTNHFLRESYNTATRTATHPLITWLCSPSHLLNIFFSLNVILPTN